MKKKKRKSLKNTKNQGVDPVLYRLIALVIQKVKLRLTTLGKLTKQLLIEKKVNT